MKPHKEAQSYRITIKIIILLHLYFISLKFEDPVLVTHIH